MASRIILAILSRAEGVYVALPLFIFVQGQNVKNVLKELPNIFVLGGVNEQVLLACLIGYMEGPAKKDVAVDVFLG